MSNEHTPGPQTPQPGPGWGPAGQQPAAWSPAAPDQPTVPIFPAAEPTRPIAPGPSFPPPPGQPVAPLHPNPFGQPYSPSPAIAPVQTKPRNGSLIAGLVALAVLAGGASGGVAGFTASRYLAPAASSAPTQTRVIQADPSHPDWTAVAAAASSSVVAIQVVGTGGNGSQGSGVVIDAQGHIVTNNHVVSSTGTNASIAVLLGHTSYAATVVGTDPATDLAVLALVNPPTDLSVIGFADSNTLAVGDPVMAIGNPLGLDNTVTNGIVSALNRPVTTPAVSSGSSSPQGDLVVTAAIQTNAAINPGNSGGALVNAAGELVGITSSIATLSSSGDSQSGSIGIGFAIGSDQVRYVADQLIEKGYADHPQIGVSANDVSGIGQRGAQIVRVTAGSPAADAGLQVGDVITSVNGEPVGSTESLVALVRAGQVGKPMELSVLRGSSTRTITVTPTAAPR